MSDNGSDVPPKVFLTKKAYWNAVKDCARAVIYGEPLEAAGVTAVIATALDFSMHLIFYSTRQGKRVAESQEGLDWEAEVSWFKSWYGQNMSPYSQNTGDEPNPQILT